MNTHRYKYNTDTRKLSCGNRTYRQSCASVVSESKGKGQKDGTQTAIRSRRKENIKKWKKETRRRR